MNIICVIDPPHDIDDQFGVQGLANRIARGELDPRDLTLIVTGDFPKEAVLAMYHVLMRTCQGRAFDVKILQAPKYAVPAGKLNDVVGADGKNWATLLEEEGRLGKGSDLARIKDGVRRAHAQDANFLVNFEAEDDNQDLIGHTVAADLDQYNGTAARQRSVELRLCAQSPPALLSLKSDVISAIYVQADVSKLTLGGFNNGSGVNAQFVRQVLGVAAASEEEVPVYIWDTTTTKGIGLKASDFPGDASLMRAQANYYKEKQLNWGGVQPIYQGADRTKIPELFDAGKHDLRATGFLMNLCTRFSLDRLLKERYVVISDETAKDGVSGALLDQLKFRLEKCYADTKPFAAGDEEIDGRVISKADVLTILNPDGSFSKETDHELCGCVEAIIERSRDLAFEGERQIRAELTQEFAGTGVQIDTGLVLYDPVVMLSEFDRLAANCGQKKAISFGPEPGDQFLVQVMIASPELSAALGPIFLKIGAETQRLNAAPALAAGSFGFFAAGAAAEESQEQPQPPAKTSKLG